MAELLHSISVMSDGSIVNTSETVMPAGEYWRVLHDYELFHKGILDRRNEKGVWFWRKGLPEVFTFDNSHTTKMPKWVQELAYALNPGMTGKQFRGLYDIRRAFTNGLGFDTVHDPNSDEYLARWDYINNIDADHALPRFDKSRVCGGAILKGTVSGSWLNVETLRVDKPQTLEYVKARPWLYFTATTVSGNSTADTELVGDFPQRGGLPVLVPLVTTYAVRYPLSWLEPDDGRTSPYFVRK